MRGLFGGRRRGVSWHGKELGRYRDELHERTERIDTRLAEVAEEIEALRRRDIDPDTAIERLTVHEEALEDESEGIQEMLAPEELHGLHMEYEANLEPITYYKRGAGNVTHARLRMAEIVEVLLGWEPGQPTEATVAARLERSKKT
jgi:hypothetical protein